MHTHYNRLRKSVFSPSREASAYLAHIIFLFVLMVYPVAMEEFNLPIGVFTAFLAVYIFLTILLPEKINYTLVLVGMVTIIHVILYRENHYAYDSIHFLIKSSLLFLFALLSFISMIREIVRSPISLKLVYLSIDGYLFLGMCFAFLFRSIHYLDPASFNFELQEEFNHIYMSFVIFTTLGLGDLVPLSMTGKALVILNGLCGQIYLAFFAAMIVGKYLSKSMEK
jgi:hypothetical protein